MIDKTCNNCGTKLSCFLETGILGCPDCYVIFESEINTLLKKIQGANQHMGKVPKINENERFLIRKLYQLVDKKEKAIAEGRVKDLLSMNKDINTLNEILKDRGII